jgi:hypothetical protein
MKLELKTVKEQLKKQFLKNHSPAMQDYMKNRLNYISDDFLDGCIHHLRHCENKECHIRNILVIYSGENIPLGKLLIEAEGRNKDGHT